MGTGRHHPLSGDFEMTIITTTLAGANFRPADAREVTKRLVIGETLELEQDPFNEYDASAVKVIAEDIFIGYIPKADNKEIFNALSRGELITAEVVAFEASLKPVLEIELP